jgi:hypothetical protein
MVPPGGAGLEAQFEREPGSAFPDERALDAEYDFRFEVQKQTSAVLESVSLGCVKLGFQPTLTPRELFPVRGKARVERIPACLFPGSIISKGRRGEHAKQCGDRKRQSSASNLAWMHHAMSPSAIPRYAARRCNIAPLCVAKRCKPYADLGVRGCSALEIAL